MSGVTLDILLTVIVLTNLVQALRINKLTEEVYLLDRRRQKKEIDDMLEKTELESKMLEALEKGVFVEIDGKVYQKKFTMDEEE